MAVRILAWIGVAFFGVVLGTMALAAEPRFLGVAACAGSTCHDAAKPNLASRITQDELTIWKSRDRHSRAGSDLRSPLGLRIARNLGIADPTTDDTCATCHLDPAHLRPDLLPSGRATFSEGVGCESCHGAASAWLASHVDPAQPASALARGLVRLDSPVARARVCIGCHQSNTGRPLRHDIYGAGHPRLRFELETFTAAMPMHHVADEDYRARKQVPSRARLWLVGQLEAARLTLEPLRRAPVRTNVFLDFGIYDCHSCHSRIGRSQAEARPDVPLPPGSLRLYDAPIVLVGAALGAIDPALSASLGQTLSELHRVHARDPVAARAVADRLSGLLDRAEPLFEADPSDEAVGSICVASWRSANVTAFALLRSPNKPSWRSLRWDRRRGPTVDGRRSATC